MRRITLYTMSKDSINRTARLLLLPLRVVKKWMKVIVNRCQHFLKMLKSKWFGERKNERKLEEE